MQNFSVFDSFPKFPVGILYDSSYQLGNFDECTTVKQGFYGQYCLTDISINDKNTTKKKVSDEICYLTEVLFYMWCKINIGTYFNKMRISYSNVSWKC